MADLDRAFVKALNCMQTMSTQSVTDPLQRPPLGARIKLYGLYKQATEGDNSLRYPPEEDERAKWSAWKKEEGLSRSEAKRRYIGYLIETIRTYGGDSTETRESLAELEYLWDQLRESEELQQRSGNVPVRSQSPAVSLYRVASGTFNSAATMRPASRPASRQGSRPASRTHSISLGSGKTLTGGPGAGAGAVFGLDDEYGSGYGSGYGPGYGYSGQKNLEFVQWQGEINGALSKLTAELERMRLERERAERGGAGPTSSLNPLGGAGAGANGGKNDDFWAVVQRKLMLWAVKVYAGASTIVKHVAADSVLLLVAYGVLRLVQMGNMRKELVRRLAAKLYGLIRYLYVVMGVKDRQSKRIPL